MKELKETVFPQASCNWENSENCCPAPEGAWLSEIRQLCPHPLSRTPPILPFLKGVWNYPVCWALHWNASESAQALPFDSGRNRKVSQDTT